MVIQIVMRMILRVVFLGLIVLMTGCSGGNDEPRNGQLIFVTSFEDGSLYRTPQANYFVLNLRGSWRDMGRQYGALLKNELRHFHDEITADVASRGMSEQDQLAIAIEIYDLYSSDIQGIIEGMAMTSELGWNELVVLNAGMMLLTQAVLNGATPSACSGIAAWGEYTPDGALVFGRNWDINREAMLKYMKYLSVAVFHPIGGHAVANIHPMGNLYLETGMNSAGIFLELNNGEQSDGYFNPQAEDTSSLLLRVLANSSTVDEAYSMLAAETADLSYIIQIADASHAISVERPTFGCRARQGEYPGLLVAYNSFVPPYPAEWEGLVAPPPPAEDDPRLENIRNLANSPKYKGKLNIEGMMRLMDVTLQEGGAVHAGTVLQVIAEPESMTIWLRGLEYSDWEQVSLQALFQGCP